jgi:hypothetical protein
MTEPREHMEGDRYYGAIAAVKHDLEHTALHWENGFIFIAGEPPPFEWAARKATTE